MFKVNNQLFPKGFHWNRTPASVRSREIADRGLDARELVDIVDGLQGAWHWALGESFDVI